MSDPRSIKFSSPLASVAFGSAPDPQRAHLEAMLVQGARNRIQCATSAQIHRDGPWIDHNILRHLSGRNYLHLARLIEERAPAAIENMLRLREKKKELVKSAEIERIFAPASLSLMIEALEMEEESGRDA